MTHDFRAQKYQNAQNPQPPSHSPLSHSHQANQAVYVGVGGYGWVAVSGRLWILCVFGIFVCENHESLPMISKVLLVSSKSALS